MLPSGIKLITFYLWGNELLGPDRFRWKLCLQINYRPKFHFVYLILSKLKLTRENIALPNILDYQSYIPTVEKREKNPQRPLQLTEFDIDFLALSTRMWFHVFVLVLMWGCERYKCCIFQPFTCINVPLVVACVLFDQWVNSL